MVWFGWALAVLGFMGLALILPNERYSRGAKAALAVGILNAGSALVALLTLLLFREHLQPSRLASLATTPSGLWLMTR